LRIALSNREACEVVLSSFHVDAKRLRPYFVGDPVSARIVGAHLILDFQTEDEERDDHEDEQGALAALAPLRVELMHGDLRIAHLAWLLAVQSEEVADKDVEPAVPPGLSQLTLPQQAMVEFLRIDADLLSAAAASSARIADDGPALLNWVRALTPSAKDEWLRCAIEDPDFAFGAELRRAFRVQAKPASAVARRTVAELLIAAEEHRERQQRAEIKRADRAEKAARGVTKKRLDALAKRVDAAWTELEALVEKKAYQEAIPLAADLRDLAARDGVLESFDVRFQSMKKRQLRCRAFFDRWKRENRPSEW
jgi:hypothetical protein